MSRRSRLPSPVIADLWYAAQALLLPRLNHWKTGIGIRDTLAYEHHLIVMALLLLIDNFKVAQVVRVDHFRVASSNRLHSRF